MEWLVTAIIGLISGALGSLIAPWIHWSIEKRKSKLEYKKSLISNWRQFIEEFDWVNNEFGNSSVYGAMRSYMNDEIVKKFEAQRTFHMPPDGGRGKNLKKQWAADEVSRIEREWDLL